MQPLRNRTRLSVIAAIAIGATLACASPADASAALGHPLVVADVVESIWANIAEWMTGGIVSLLDAVVGLIMNAPEPDVSGKNAWFLGQYATMFRIAALLTLPLALVATIGAILKGGIAEVMKTYLVGIPVALIGTVVALSVITFMLKIDQSFSDALMGQFQTDYRDFLQKVTSAPPDKQNAGVNFLLCLIFLFMAIAAIIMYTELIFRCVAIYLGVLFLPLGFASFVWSGSRPWYSRLSRTITGVILMKFVIVAALAVSFAMIRFSFGDMPSGNPDAMPTHIATLLAGLVAFLFASVCAPALVGVIIGQEGVPGMSRKEFGRYTPMSADSRFTRSEYASLIPPKARFWKN